MKQNILGPLLDKLIHGQMSAGKLSGGLCLQYKPGDDDNPDCRLCAYRVDVPVGAVELGTLRRELEELLPGQVITLDAERTIEGQDGHMRHYRVFRWPGTPPVQLALLHVDAAKRPYTED